MSKGGNGGSRLDEIRARVVGQLRHRLPEIEQAIYAYILRTVPDPVEGLDADYHAGVLTAISAIVEYSLDGIRQGPGRWAPIPQAATAQVQRAARADVGVGTVVRRYLAGHGCLGQFVAQELDEQVDLSSHGSALHHLYRTQEALLQHLTAAVEQEYNKERERANSPEQRCAAIVHRLLAGEPVGPTELAELDYEFHAAWHLAVIVIGEGAKDTLRRLDISLGRKFLPVSHHDKAVWVWFGSQRKPTAIEIERILSTNGATTDVSLAVGEPARGIDGWRLTHHQAQGALRVALRTSEKCAQYEPFLAAAAQDDTLARSLKERYLMSLANQRDGGAVMRQTLRAYIDAHGSATTAAKPLKVDRHTVENRLHTVEDLIGCPLYTCLAKIDVALRIEEFDG